MARKRMFTKNVVESDMFLSMPLSSQALYFHLNMKADDDGFVGNPKGIQRLIGAAEDDLKLLIVKGFLIPLDHGVVVIKHWRMHNTIRWDRYSPTVFQDEAQEVYIKQNQSYTTDKNKAVASLATSLNKNGNPDIGLNLDIDISKDIYKQLPNKNGNQNKKTETAEEDLCDKVRVLYNAICKSFQPIERMTKKRRQSILEKFKEGSSIETFKDLFTKAASAEYFVSLQEREGWKPTFDWLIQEEHMNAVLEGKYDKLFDFKTQKKNKFNNFKGRQYSQMELSELEKKLLE